MGSSDEDGHNTVALKRLDGLARHLAATPKGGRHQALYSIARTLGQLVASGHLTHWVIHNALFAAADTNGLLAEDGEHNIYQTIGDGIAKGVADGPDPDHHERGERNPYTLRPPEDGPAAAVKGTGIRAVDIPFDTVPSEKVEWFYEGRIPLGDLTLLVGPPGLGKTTFACELAARGTLGKLEGDAADVIFVSAEDSLAHTLVPRFEVAGADLGRAHGMKMELEADGLEVGFTLPNHTGQLQGLVEETGANLIVLDPVVGHLSGDIDSHKDHSVRRALAPLAALAESTGAAVLGIMHLNKSTSTDVLQRINGSGGFGASARSVLLFGEDPKAPEGSPDRLLIHAKSNFGHLAPAVRLKVEGRTFTTAEGEEAETAGIVWMGEDQTATAARVLGGRQEPKKLDAATDFLREVLADGPLPPAEIKALAEDEEITLATLKRAANRLGIGSKRDKFGTWSSWSLPNTRLILPNTRLTLPKNEPRERVIDRKPLQDNGSTTRLITAELLSHEGSDEPTSTTRLIAKGMNQREPTDEPSEPNGLANVLAGLQVDGVEQLPNLDEEKELPIPW